MPEKKSGLSEPEIVYAAYRLVEKKFVKEVNAECLLFEHIRSGAHVFKIPADDPNKTFSIAFRTIPESDAGTPHIMEHSVLNGSRNFPVRSPFDILSKGSLHTFLNAMTSAAFTIYPVASINKQDYFNLMHVYLDAVFNPLIYDDPRIFMQEGWHLELVDKDAPLEYKGVVYNEMKGSFSNPERELWYQVLKNLFPGSAFRFSSGGYPTAIPSLTREDFIRFHKKNYHPSNSYIYLYGDVDLSEELNFIDREYLSKYEKVVVSPDIIANPPFAEIKEASAYYPIIEEAPDDDQSYLSLNWVIGSIADPATSILLEILADVLVNQESGPVRKALQEAGIGKDIYASSTELIQHVFSIVVQNARPADKESFRTIVMNTLEKVVADKIDRESLLGSLNRLEFRLREGDDAQKGLTYNMRSIASWIFTKDPFPYLEYEKQLERVKASIDNFRLEEVIKNDMIRNPHGLLMMLEPKPGLEKEYAASTAAGLAGIKAKLTPSELDELVQQTSDLIAYQQKEDSIEAIATIPMLKLDDINRSAEWYKAEQEVLSGVPHLYYHEFTNNIVYINYWFDLRVLPESSLPYAALLTQLLGKLDTDHYHFEQLDNALNISTGSFNASLYAFLPGYVDHDLVPKFRIQMKTTTEKLKSGLELTGEIVHSTKFGNDRRLYELLSRHQSQVESLVLQNGFAVSSSRLESYYSRRGVFAERTRGIEYYWFVTGLVKQFRSDPAVVIENLNQVYHLLFAKNNLIAGVTCGKQDFGSYTSCFESFAAMLSPETSAINSWKLEPVQKNEGIMSASKVQYVLQGFDFRKLGFNWDGKWKVLSQIISTDWLQTRIRVIGGAYGGYSVLSKNGTLYLASYRDPNLSETLANFEGTADYLSSFDADTTAMTRYIIGTVANLDSPLTPSEKGDQAFRWHFEKVAESDIQADRDAVLATTATDIRNMSTLIRRVVEQKVLCVYGNDEKIKANGKLFDNLVTLKP